MHFIWHAELKNGYIEEIWLSPLNFLQICPFFRFEEAINMNWILQICPFFRFEEAINMNWILQICSFFRFEEAITMNLKQLYNVIKSLKQLYNVIKSLKRSYNPFFRSEEAFTANGIFEKYASKGNANQKWIRSQVMNKNSKICLYLFCSLNLSHIVSNHGLEICGKLKN